MVIAGFLSCEFIEEGKWDLIGRQMVKIDNISAPDTITTGDTMTVRIWSEKIEGDKFENDTVEVARDSSSVALSLCS